MTNPFGGALARYADCVVQAGVALRRGDILTITAPPGHRELAVALARTQDRRASAAFELPPTR